MKDAPLPAAVKAPDWRAGSRWEYSDGYALRVASVSNGDAVFERLDAKNQWFSMHGFLRQDAASATAKRQTIFRSVSPSDGEVLSPDKPLTFQREYLSNGQLIVHASSWTLEGRERITVPAGTFDCWVIVWRARSLKSDWTGFERWWYSPEAQLYVRLEYKYGSMDTASRVLMRYSLPGGETPIIKPAVAVKEHAAVEMKPVPVATLNLAPVASIVPMPVAELPMAPDPALWAGARPDGVWVVQIATSKAKPDADRLLTSLAGSRAELVHDLPSGIEKSQSEKRGSYYRAWIGGYDSPEPARSLCRELRAEGADCIIHQRDLTIPLRRN